MNQSDVNSWQDIQSEVLERIRSRHWKPGELIPNEADLAREFGCARATVNRALQAVADAGWIDRKRKAGTRVATHPERKAVLSIPVIRKEVESTGKAYSHQVLHSSIKHPPAKLAKRMNFVKDNNALEIHTLHQANGKPYAYEERWMNIDHLPEALETDFSVVSSNEWLVQNAPFTKGKLAFSATNATGKQAKILGIETGSAVFRTVRSTWHETEVITFVTLFCPPGYQLKMSL
ncbi:MAG: GntR family transcriptional regulator [Rhizobiaceae bacterium]